MGVSVREPRRLSERMKVVTLVTFDLGEMTQRGLGQTLNRGRVEGDVDTYRDRVTALTF